MKIFSFFSKKVLIYGAAGIAAVIVIAISIGGGNGKERVLIGKGVIVQEVAATGKVKPNMDVNLGFDKSGRVASVNAYVGDVVQRGETIASLEAGETSAEIAKASALLEEETIRLREIKNTAPISYNDAYKNLEAEIKEGFAAADNAVRNKADQFFKNDSTTPQFEVSFNDGNFVHYFSVPADVKLDLNAKRAAVEKILEAWQKRLGGLNSSNISSEANLSIDDLNTISVFLDRVAEAINTFTPAEFAYETTVNTYKTTASSARTEVTGAIGDLVTAKDKLNSSGTLSGTGQFESVLAQEAKVSQARAALSSLEASFGKSVITAPFTGVITVQDAKVGGAVSAGETLVSMTSQNEMYIEANISEINIGKVAEGNPATVTFDAFQGEIFKGFVSFIEPGDVVVDGVVNYKIRVDLENSDPRIKNGLTSNLKIETSRKENVLSVPLYAVAKEDGKNFVNKIENNKIIKTEIGLGLSGNNGFAEVLSGLSEGDIVEF